MVKKLFHLCAKKRGNPCNRYKFRKGFIKNSLKAYIINLCHFILLINVYRYFNFRKTFFKVLFYFYDINKLAFNAPLIYITLTYTYYINSHTYTFFTSLYIIFNKAIIFLLVKYQTHLPSHKINYVSFTIIPYIYLKYVSKLFNNIIIND